MLEIYQNILRNGLEDIMKFTFMPDFYFSAFDKVGAEFLLENKVCGIILDIDNTLEPYENALPSEGVREWLSILKENGISAAFVSNNNKERVELFNSELKLPAFPKAGKPFKKNLLRAMEAMGTNKDNTIIMGDQIFTDVLAGRFAGIRTILVPPIKDKTDLLTKFKRWLEKPIIKKYNNRLAKLKNNGEESKK